MSQNSYTQPHHHFASVIVGTRPGPPVRTRDGPSVTFRTAYAYQLPLAVSTWTTDTDSDDRDSTDGATDHEALRPLTAVRNWMNSLNYDDADVLTWATDPQLTVSVHGGTDDHPQTERRTGTSSDTEAETDSGVDSDAVEDSEAEAHRSTETEPAEILLSYLQTATENDLGVETIYQGSLVVEDKHVLNLEFSFRTTGTDRANTGSWTFPSEEAKEQLLRDLDTVMRYSPTFLDADNEFRGPFLELFGARISAAAQASLRDDPRLEGSRTSDSLRVDERYKVELVTKVSEHVPNSALCSLAFRFETA